MSVKLILRGGLGNQLFQYAALRAHTLSRKTELLIDLRYYDAYNSEFDKRSWIQDFPISAKLISYRSRQEANNLKSRLVRRLLTERPKIRYLSETIGFDPQLQNIRNSQVVTGLFQSPLHFESEWRNLEGELDLVKRGVINLEHEYGRFPFINYVAVHVRRGDYLNNSGFSMPDSIRYYTDAMNIVDLSGRRFLIFSDDIEWCRQQEVFKGADYFQNDGRPPYYTMFAMSACHAVIIANSTFSWWGGWFAHRRGANVIAPKMWILGQRTIELGLVPSQWSIV